MQVCFSSYVDVTQLILYASITARRTSITELQFVFQPFRCLTVVLILWIYCSYKCFIFKLIKVLLSFFCTYSLFRMLYVIVFFGFFLFMMLVTDTDGDSLVSLAKIQQLGVGGTETCYSTNYFTQLTPQKLLSKFDTF